MTLFRLISLFSGLIFAVACGAPDDAERPPPNVSGDFATDHGSTDKSAYINALENRMTEFEASLSAMEGRANSADQAMKGELFLRIGGLRSQLSQFKGELYVFAKSNMSFDEGILSIEQSWGNLQLSYSNVHEYFNSNIKE